MAHALTVYTLIVVKILEYIPYVRSFLLWQPWSFYLDSMYWNHHHIKWQAKLYWTLNLMIKMFYLVFLYFLVLLAPATIFYSYLHHYLFQSWRNCDGSHFNEKIRLCNSSQWVHRFGLRYIFYLLAPIGNFCLFWASFWNKSRRLQNQCESCYLTLIENLFLFRHLLCWWLKIFHMS